MIHSFLPNKGEVRTFTPTITWFLWHWSLNLLEVLSVTVIFLTISWFLHMNPISLSFKCWSGHMRSKAKHRKKDGWLCFRHEKVGARGPPRICLVNLNSFFTLDSYGQHSSYKAFIKIVFKKPLTAIFLIVLFVFFMWKVFSTKKKERMLELLLLVSFVLFWNVVQYWR